jgi:hypothetical protein
LLYKKWEEKSEAIWYTLISLILNHETTACFLFRIYIVIGEV